MCAPLGFSRALFLCFFVLCKLVELSHVARSHEWRRVASVVESSVQPTFLLSSVDGAGTFEALPGNCLALNWSLGSCQQLIRLWLLVPAFVEVTPVSDCCSDLVAEAGLCFLAALFPTNCFFPASLLGSWVTFPVNSGGVPSDMKTFGS